MTLKVTHGVISTATDSGNGLISANAWNQGHVLAGSANKLVGLDPGGSGAEITVASPLTYDGATLGFNAAAGAPTLTFSGDATGTGTTSVALTLSNSGVTAGTYGDATHSLTAIVDAKGRVASLTAQLVTPAFSSLTGVPTTIAGYGITDALKASNNLSDVTNATTARTNLDVPSNEQLAAAIATVSGSGGSSGGSITGFVSGGNAIWTSGLTFTVTAAQYYINGTLYTSAQQSITLSAADASNPRIDVLALDTTGTLVKITGTASANPSEPDIDPSSQIEVTFVSVPANATSPTGATNENIYLEGTEWTASVTGSHITAGSTNNPRTGSKDVEATSAVTGDSVLFNKGATLDPSGYSNLVFYLRNKTASWSKTTLRVNFTNAAGARVGAIVSVASGTFGFTTTNTSSYQAVSIPLTNFAIPAGTLIQKLNIAVSGTTAIGWYLDDMVLQSNGTGGGGGGGLTQTQADARYLKQASNLSDLASAPTARANLGLHAVTSQTGTTYTAVLADADSYIQFNNASAITFTIPPNSSVAFPVGTAINMEQTGAGALTVAAGAGVTINSRLSDLTLAGQYAVAFVKKVATDTWTMNGDL